MNVCGWKWVMVDSRIGDMSAPSTFNVSCQIAPGRTISPHRLSRGLKNVRKCFWVIWPVLWLWGFWYFDILPQIPLCCLSPTLYWNILSKYFGIVVRPLNMDSLWNVQKKDRILISMFACWATLSMWHRPLNSIWCRKILTKYKKTFFS